MIRVDFCLETADELNISQSANMWNALINMNLQWNVCFVVRTECFNIYLFRLQIMTIFMILVVLCRSVTDPRDGRKVALKKMPNVFQNLVSCKRVFRELRMLCFFKHDNVTTRLLFVVNGTWNQSVYRWCESVLSFCPCRFCRLLTFCSLHRSTASRKCILSLFVRNSGSEVRLGLRLFGLISMQTAQTFTSSHFLSHFLFLNRPCHVLLFILLI